MALPLISRGPFGDADRLVLAMEARCYSENRTDPELDCTGKDYAALGLVLGVSLAALGHNDLYRAPILVP